MSATRVLGAIGTLVLGAACGGELQRPGDSSPGPSPQPLAPLPPSRAPELPDRSERDAGGNRLDDALDERLRQAAGNSALLAEPVRVQVILNAPLEQAELDDFVADGGKVEYAFRRLSYGFVGSIALGKLEGLAGHWRLKLHLVAAPSVVVPFLDEATRTGRTRGIWASGFAGSVSGYSGSSNITIAILDTGVYEQHLDLSGRKQGWQDYTSDDAAAPLDAGGHGTHVAGIAVGSGAAFGAGPATLNYTQSGEMDLFGANTFAVSPIHTPHYLGSAATLSASVQARFLGGGSANLFTMSADDGTTNYTAFGSVSGASPLSLPSQNGGSTADLHQGGLIQTDPPTITNFAVANSVGNYPGVGDGFNALRGVAPSSKWFGAKVFTDAGTGTGLEVAVALDDLADRKVADNVKVANLSLGVLGSGTDTVIRAFVNGIVDEGIVVVVAAGNDHPLTIGDPGRAAKVITVGASNDLNQVTTYTSLGPTGVPAGDDTQDNKPDVLAPGGSAYRSQILAADTGTTDGKVVGFPDLVANDYASMQGTSMATPFVAGSVALMIDALQQSGTSWSFASSAQPLLLKMLLSASATETNTAREQTAGNNPTLGRATTPRDRFEGYGIINPDAAIEALVQSFVSPLSGTVNSAAPARLEWERRAWGRHLSLINGATVLLNLSVPATADYDLYLYAGAPTSKGNPVMRASSVSAGSGTDETISYVSSATETAYLFVKRISGHGAFSVTGSAVSHCGDGILDAGELCDPDIAGSEVCCTATCTTVSDGSSCNDGDLCTQTDSCQAGSCTGSNSKPCPASDSCHEPGTCASATGACTNPQKMNGATCSDDNLCTQTDTCTAGVCSGSNPIVCSASDQCHNAGICAPATGVCSNPVKNDGSACNDGSLCTQTDTCQAGTCTGGSPIVCAASDQCHNAGTCAPATGVCSNPTKADDSVCNDANLCTEQDLCQAGACVGLTPVVCLPKSPCHDAGVCDSASGACSEPTKPDGSTCNDGSLCTQSDSCQAGTCTGAQPVVCAAPDECHEAGSCQAVSGGCTPVAKPDGTACGKQGTCQTGTCVEPPSGEGGAGGAGGEASGAGGATAEAGAGGDAGETGSGGSAGSESAGTSSGGATAGAAGAGVGGGSAGAESGGGASPLVPTTSGPNTASGCGCSVPGGSGTRSSALLVLFGLVLFGRRRRRH